MTIESSNAIELRQAIQAFADSTRFQILKNLQVGRLMPEGCGDLGAIEEMTFETLVELGSERIKKSMRLTALQQASLVELLRALSSDQDLLEPVADADHDAETLNEPRVHSQNDQVLESGASSENVLSSVQLEINLRQRLQELRDHPNYSTIKRTTLSTYWDVSWAPAPFEQALTIDQLSSMDPSVLFKKRMVNEQRISHMVIALERALASLRIATADSSAALKPTVIVTPRVASSEIPLSWSRLRDDIPAIEGGMIELLVRVAADRDNEQTRAVMLSVMNTISPEEFIGAATGREIPDLLQERLYRLGSELVGSVTHDLIRAALSGPGIPESLVLGILSSVVGDSGTVARLLSVLLIRGLGARRVTYQGVDVEGFWTLHVGLLETIASRGRITAIEGLLDPKLLELVKDQEGQKKKGKGRPQSRVKRRGKGK